MHYELSPYALLQASKPKNNHTMTTVYDLYSAAHSSQAMAHDAPRTGHLEERISQEADRQTAAVPARTTAARKTHYIADIQTRHNAAIRRSTLS